MSLVPTVPRANDTLSDVLSTITRLSKLILRDELPQRQSRDLIHAYQQDATFQLALLKMQRLSHLRKKCANDPPRRLLISNNIATLDPEFKDLDFGTLPRGFFDARCGSDIEERCHQLAGAIVVINNNDLGPNPAAEDYCAIYSRCNNTIFLAWDWDNHHWLDRSTLLAAHSDLYAPAHDENLYLLSRLNPTTVGPVYCASVQWSRKLLAESLALLLTTKRKDDPLGMHIPYAGFDYRNRVITTLGRNYSTVGFSDRAFHQRGPEDRLLEWAGHKAHWIVPVLNDVPIRVFDALATGGIPIVPQSLRHRAPIRDIPREYVVFYGPADIVEPESVVAQANTLFNNGGAAGIAARHRFAVEQHHGNHRLSQMMRFVSDQLSLE